MERAQGTDELIAELSETALNILVVEDSESNQALIEIYFKQTTCNLDFADDGDKAVAMFKDSPYDLVLMDIQMPVMDGYEATRLIRELEQQRGVDATPILAVTANAFKEDQDECMAVGCTDYLTKPVSKMTLLESVARHTKYKR